MDECDERPVRSRTRRGFDDTNAGSRESIQRRLDIGNSERDVVDTGSTLSHEGANHGLRLGSFEQLDG